MTQSATLSAKKRKAIVALMVMDNVSEAAQEAGVSRSTLHRWMKEDEFVAALMDAERQAISDFTRSLAGMLEAVTIAYRTALDEEEPIAVRLRAANSIVDRIVSLRQLVDFEERLTRLEQAR